MCGIVAAVISESLNHVDKSEGVIFASHYENTITCWASLIWKKKIQATKNFELVEQNNIHSRKFHTIKLIFYAQNIKNMV